MDLQKTYAHRISSIRVDKTGVLSEYLNKNPLKFCGLTSLDLENVLLAKECLLELAPQLQYLRLSDLLHYNLFDLTVDKDSKCFTKLKNLKLEYLNIDVKTILMRSCNTLEYLELKIFYLPEGLKDLQHEFKSLKTFSIIFKSSSYKATVRILLTKFSGCLITLTLKVLYKYDENELFKEIDFLNQPMKITTLVIELPHYSCINIEPVLLKCPMLQNLTLDAYYHELNEVVLNDLKYLEFGYCDEF